MRDLLQYPSNFITGRLRTSVTPIGARQIHPRGFKIGDTAENRFESLDALGNLVLVQQRNSQQPEAIHLSGLLSIQHAKPALGAGGTAGTQRRVRSTKALGERGVSHVVRQVCTLRPSITKS